MSTALDEIRKDMFDISTATELHDFLVQLHREWDNDPETAHLTEDQVKSHVIDLIADGHPESRELARELAAVGHWNVERWYA